MKRLLRLLLGASFAVPAYGCQEKVVVADGPTGPLTQSHMDGGAAASTPIFSSGPLANDKQLQASIDIAGMPFTSLQLACGQCVDFTVGVSGGRPPYSYVWSDTSLSGSGPFHICPVAPLDYVVRVSDTASEGEIRRPSVQTDARLHVDVAPCASTPGSGPGVGAPKDAGGTHIPTTPTNHRDAGGILPGDGGAHPIHDARPPPAADTGPMSRTCPCSNAVTWADDYFTDPSFEDQSSPSRMSCSGSATATNVLITSSGNGSAQDGSWFLGLALPTQVSETLRQPLRAGQRYWLSWDMDSSSQITAFTGIPLGQFDIFGAASPCVTTELLGEQYFRPTDPGGWIHVCVEFVPSRNYSYVVLSARVGNGVGSGFVSIDAMRVAPYEPTPTDYLFPNCAALPVYEPFP